MNKEAEELFYAQIEEWELASKNYKALDKVAQKEVQLEEAKLTLQYNPGRIISSSAKVDKATLAQRPCFLCDKNRPVEQRGVKLSGNFTLLVNPFPILRKHFTIINNEHIPQRLLPYLKDLLRISKDLTEEYSLFYNGAKCGASAPDHMHFQAGLSVQFPIWNLLEEISMHTLYEVEKVTVKSFESYVIGIYVEGNDAATIIETIAKVVESFSALHPNEEEPMINLLAKFNEKWEIIIFPREKHRSSQYFEEGEKQILLSPASVDFGGLIAVPRKEDFNRLDAALLKDIFKQLCLNTRHFNELKEKIRAL